MTLVNSVYRSRNRVTFNLFLTIMAEAMKWMRNKWPIKVLLCFDFISEYVLFEFIWSTYLYKYLINVTVVSSVFVISNLMLCLPIFNSMTELCKYHITGTQMNFSIYCLFYLHLLIEFQAVSFFSQMHTSSLRIKLCKSLEKTLCFNDYPHW